MNCQHYANDTSHCGRPGRVQLKLHGIWLCLVHLVQREERLVLAALHIAGQKTEGLVTPRRRIFRTTRGIETLEHGLESLPPDNEPAQ